MLFLYHILTPKGQSVQQFVIQYHKKYFTTICETTNYDFCDRTRVTERGISEMRFLFCFLSIEHLPQYLFFWSRLS